MYLARVQFGSLFQEEPLRSIRQATLLLDQVLTGKASMDIISVSTPLDAWHNFPFLWIRINVDGSSIQEGRLVGYGGIARDFRGGSAVHWEVRVVVADIHAILLRRPEFLIVHCSRRKMSFFFGLVIGITLGIGLIVAFVHSENTRSKLRSELAKAVAAFARMTVEDSRKILPAEFYPSWLTWLNHHLTKIWPYVDEAASELIRTSVEPTLEQYTPVILSSLKFSKFTLGTVAPQFTGVSIIEDGGGGITMELELQWDGNPSIILDIKTRLGVVLPVQVKNIGFTGVFRLIFKPLVDEFPCFGAVCYSLREKKKLDFTLKFIGGDISSIPGISDAIESKSI
ncbi:hypothetical protein HHK36_013898 [Tetracentron sinense]|uniref:SMP-LTD domain-containing protein n=1 Tax=Tetracentron sinense TaxID=13715 RepID=A0A834Z2Y6_TETSI|nr:hypothetical protein HHK36_013898 [Tetracentron sinense]